MRMHQKPVSMAIFPNPEKAKRLYAEAIGTRGHKQYPVESLSDQEVEALVWAHSQKLRPGLMVLTGREVDTIVAPLTWFFRHDCYVIPTNNHWYRPFSGALDHPVTLAIKAALGSNPFRYPDWRTLTDRCPWLTAPLPSWCPKIDYRAWDKEWDAFAFVPNPDVGAEGDADSTQAPHKDLDPDFKTLFRASHMYLSDISPYWYRVRVLYQSLAGEPTQRTA